MNQVCVVFTTVDTIESAKTLAEKAVNKDLAACVNIFPGVSSVYKWKGALEIATETSMLFTTSKAKAQEFITWITEKHPYEVPVILQLAHETTQDYLQFVENTFQKDAVTV